VGSAVEQATLLGVAFVLASVIGLERELRNRSAGLRTHALVGLGAALFTLAGRFGFDDGAGSVDATRNAAQVVSGSCRSPRLR
jgi:putative Mg2+ transporter-C (MgtC) family protein